ncbi:POK6 protein, partial [Nothoprocta pentlandii]|nr:POK6 protein [Nothoprocta pentlandii]
VELTAVVRVFRRWSVPLNLITDSAYVAGIVARAETSMLCDISHFELFALLQELIFLLDSRPHPYFVMHVRSHTSLPGFIAEGNRRADILTLPVQVLPDCIAQAKLSHSFFHQNAGGLMRFLSAQPSSLSRSLWTAAQPSGVSATPPSLVSSANL